MQEGQLTPEVSSRIFYSSFWTFLKFHLNLNASDRFSSWNIALSIGADPGVKMAPSSGPPEPARPGKRTFGQSGAVEDWRIALRWAKAELLKMISEEQEDEVD